MAKEEIKTLKVGDEVMWSGCFGMETSQKVRVTGMEVTDTPRSKYGEEVSEVSWDLIKQNRVIFSLANNHWCYAEQVSMAS
jgi:hypothetical protein